MEAYCNNNSPNARNGRSIQNRNHCNSMNYNENRMQYDRRNNEREHNMHYSYDRANTRENHNRNRAVEVECVCQVNRASDCHQHDEMEQLGCDFPLVMAYVPWQQWGDMYELECGLMQGTIFKDLNFIFCGERC